jgi:MFS family permease
MFAVLRQRNFGLLWFGGLISMIGDWVLIVGLPYEVYRRTGSTVATAGMVVAFLVPSIALGSVAGVYVDRWDRRRLMITVNLLLAVCLLPLLAVDALGIWIAYGVLVASSCLEQLFEPAEVALVPRLLHGGEGELVVANSLIGVGRNLSRLIGPLIGGVVVAVGGLLGVAAVDAASFVISALVLSLIRVGSARATHHPSLEEETVTAWRKLVREWRDGLRVTVSEPVLRSLLFFMTVTRIGEGLTLTLFVPWVLGPLQSNSAGYGALLSTQAIGGLAGALVIARYGARMNPLALLVGGATIFGLIDLVLFTYPAVFPFIGPALVGMVVVGVPGAAMQAGIVTLEQTHTLDSHRGRVLGAIGAAGALGSLVGAVGAGFLGQFMPVVLLLVVQGSGYLLCGLAVGYLTRGREPAAVGQPG